MLQTQAAHMKNCHPNKVYFNVEYLAWRARSGPTQLALLLPKQGVQSAPRCCEVLPGFISLHSECMVRPAGSPPPICSVSLQHGMQHPVLDSECSRTTWTWLHPHHMQHISWFNLPRKRPTTHGPDQQCEAAFSLRAARACLPRQSGQAGCLNAADACTSSGDQAGRPPPASGPRC